MREKFFEIILTKNFRVNFGFERLLDGNFKKIKTLESPNKLRIVRIVSLCHKANRIRIDSQAIATEQCSDSWKFKETALPK